MLCCNTDTGRDKINIDKILNTQFISFNPPKRKNYEIIDKEESKIITLEKSNIVAKEVEFIPRIDIGKSSHYSWLEKKCYKVSQSERMPNSYLIALFITNKNAIVRHHSSLAACQSENDKHILIYSHQENETLGDIYPFLLDLSSMLKINIIAYDYSCYGHSTNFIEPPEYNTCDLLLILNFCETILRIDVNKFILMGRSLGAYPLVRLISYQEHFSSIMGIILISPIFEVKNNKMNFKFKCKTDLPKINPPIFLVHGVLDEHIPKSLSETATNYINNLYLWFPKKGDHENILTEFRYKFYKKFKFFLEYLYKNKVKQRRFSRKLTIKFRKHLGDDNEKKVDGKSDLDDDLNSSDLSYKSDASDDDEKFAVMYSSVVEGEDDSVAHI